MSNTTTAMLNRDAVCAVSPACGNCVCDICRGERMTPQRYAELFGEAA